MDESLQQHLTISFDPRKGSVVVTPKDDVIPTKLKLSEAIRIGARLRPQCTRTYWHNGGTCAIGAALEATGFPVFRSTQGICEHIERHWPTAPTGDIYRRNDGGESRESIADWLEAQGL